MDDSDFDLERTEYTFEPGDTGGETDESQLPQVKSIQDFLKEEYELIHGDLDPEGGRRDGKGVFIKTGDPTYKNQTITVSEHHQTQRSGQCRRGVRTPSWPRAR